MSDTIRSFLDLQQARNVAIREIAEGREEIIRAFMAKYGCGPEDVEQVVSFEGNKIRWYVHWRDPK